MTTLRGIRLALALACVACMTGSPAALGQLKTAPPPPPQKWRHVKSEHFDMLSCSSASESRDLLIHLEQFRDAFFRLFNLGRAHEEKLTIVLFDNARQYYTYHPHPNCSGFFTKSPLENFMVLSTENPDRAYRTIIHEYVHSIVSDYIKNIPLCFNEGLTTFFDSTDIIGDSLRIGATNAARVRWLQRQRKLIPLSVLLDPVLSRSVYRDPEQAALFYTQSWLLAHYLIAGRHSGPRAGAFDKFSTLSKDKKIPIAQAFEDSFGMSMDEMEKNLRQYLRGGAFATRTIKSPPKPIAAKITVTPADELNVEYVLDILANGICKCLLRNLDDASTPSAKQDPLAQLTARMFTTQPTAQSSPEQWAMIARGANPDHIAPHHRLAAISLQKNHFAQTVEHLRQAVNLNSDNAKAHLILASLLAPGSLDIMAPGKHLPAGLAAELRPLLDKAIALDPDYIEAYEAQLVVEAHSEKMRAGVIKEAIAAIGPRRNQHPVAMTALALIAWRDNDHATSRRIVDALLTGLPSPPAPRATGAKRPPPGARKTPAPATSTRATATPARSKMTSRKSLPVDFSHINYANTVRHLDKLLAGNETAGLKISLNRHPRHHFWLPGQQGILRGNAATNTLSLRSDATW